MPTDRDVLSIDPKDVFRRASAIGSAYGFTYAPTLFEERRRERVRADYPEGCTPDAFDKTGAVFAQFLKQVKEHGLTPTPRNPFFLWHSNITPGRPTPKQIAIHFHILGIDRPLADTVLIHALRALVEEVTKKDPRVIVNSIGDKETGARYSRELGAFFKKRGHLFPSDCVSCATRDPLDGLFLLQKRGENTEGIPAPVDFLSEASRVHFEALLEHLEATNTEYELSPHLLNRGNGLSETYFEIRDQDGSTIVSGGRYGELARKFFKNAHALGGVVRFASKTINTCEAPKKHVAKVAFVQLGTEAKRESLRLTEELRKARIPLAQALGIESLTEQMQVAERSQARYLLIMGHKEALDRSIVVRNRETLREESVPLTELSVRLKELLETA